MENGRVDAIELIRVRLDDKLSRIARGQAAGEDVTLDLMGDLILLPVAECHRAKTKGGQLKCQAEQCAQKQGIPGISRSPLAVR